MIVTANIEGIWVLIVLVSVIAQIIKAGREKAKARQAAEGEDLSRRDLAPTTQAKASPNNELRDFLEQLTGAQPRPRPEPEPRAVREPSGARIAPVMEARSLRPTASRTMAPRRSEPPVRASARVRPPEGAAKQRARDTQPAFGKAPAAVAAGDVLAAATERRRRRSASALLARAGERGLVAPAMLRQQIARDLRDPDAVRRGIVMSEILRPPVALRRGGLSPAESR